MFARLSAGARVLSREECTAWNDAACDTSLWMRQDCRPAGDVNAARVLVARGG
jgi:hypothetical protein